MQTVISIKNTSSYELQNYNLNIVIQFLEIFKNNKHFTWIMFIANSKYSNHLHIVIYVISMLIRNSPQILVNSQRLQAQTVYLLSLLKFSMTLKFIITLITLFVMLSGIFQIFYRRKSTFLLQLYQFIIGPIQIYVCSHQVSKFNQQTPIHIYSFFAVNLIIACVIILVLPFTMNFNFESSRIKSLNTLSAHYELLVALNFVLMATLPFFIKNPTLNLSIFFIVRLIKSIVCFTKINYEKAEVEYCSILGQFTSWICFISIFLSQHFNINSIILVWLNTILIVILVQKKNKSVILLLQKKYRKAILEVKQSLVDDMNACQSRRSTIDEVHLTQMFTVFINIVKHNQLQRNDWIKINFDQSMFSEMFTILDLFHRFLEIQNKDKKTINYRELVRKKHYTRNANASLSHGAKFDQQSIEVQWSMIWQLSSSIRQFQQQSYCTLRTLLIHQAPLKDIKTNYRLMYLYYLNVDAAQKSFFKQISQSITYHYLTERIFSEYRNNTYQGLQNSIIPQIKPRKTVLVNYDDTQLQQLENKGKLFRQNQNQTNKMINCLQASEQAKGVFGLYYHQVQLQKQAQQQFYNILSLQKNILDLVSKNQNKQTLLQLLMQKNHAKSLIRQKIFDMQSTNLFKSIVYKFMLEYYIENMPNVALNNLKLRNFDDFLYSQGKHQPNNLKKTCTNLNLSRAKGSEDSKNMIVFVSGIKNFGQITYCCPNFKQKMQILTPNSRNSEHRFTEKLSIHTIMLPIWIDKHLHTISLNNLSEETLFHQGKKFHIVSQVEKIVYEVSFQIHYIVNDMDDMLFGMDITAKQVQKLKIYKDSKLVFENVKTKYQKSNNKSLKGGHMSRKVHKTIKKCVQQQDDHSKFDHSTQTIFGQKYDLYRTYKDSKHQNNQNKNKSKNHETQSLYYNLNDNPEIHSSPSFSVTDSQTSVIEQSQKVTKSDKFINQIKIREYSKSELFFKRKFQMFTFIHWQIPPLILTISFLVKNYAAQKQMVNFNMYRTKLTIQQSFLLADTHLQNNIFNLQSLNTSKNFIGDKFSEVINILSDDILVDVETLRKRQYIMNEYFINDSPLLDIAFQPIDPTQVNSLSFYFSSLSYDVRVFDYISTLALNVSKQSIFPQTDAFDYIRKLQTQRFFNKFLHRYEIYFDNQQNQQTLFSKISQSQAEIYGFYKDFLTYFLIALVIVSFLTASQFVIVYVDLEFNIQKLVLGLINMTKAQINLKTVKIDEIETLLQNCKSNIPQKIIKKYHKSCISVNTRQRHTYSFLNPNTNGYESLNNNELVRRSGYEKKGTPHSSRVKILCSYLKQILVFALLFFISEILLILFIDEIINQVSLLQRFSSGNEKLAKVTAISNEISLEMNLAIYEFTNKTLHFQQRIEEYSRMDKLRNIQSLELNSESYFNYTYSNICDLFPNSIKKPFLCSKNISISYADCISTNRKHFQIMIKYLNSDEPINMTKINIHMRQIYMKLSILNWFTEQFFQISQDNYKQIKRDPSRWLNLLIVEMVVIILVLNWYTFQKIYKKMKTLYQQAFSLHPAHEMVKLESFRFYTNQALSRKVDYVSGEFTQ